MVCNICTEVMYVGLCWLATIGMSICRKGSPHSVMGKVLWPCSKWFKLQLCYYIHFMTNTFRKGMNRLIPSSYIITVVLQQEWLWHKITHKGWYAIKQKQNQIKHYVEDHQRIITYEFVPASLGVASMYYLFHLDGLWEGKSL